MQLAGFILNTATHHTIFPLAWVNTPNIDLKSFGIQFAKRDGKREVVTKCWLSEILHGFGAARYIGGRRTWQQSCLDVSNCQSSKLETYVPAYTHTNTNGITRNYITFHKSQICCSGAHVSTKQPAKPPVTSKFHKVHNENKVTAIPEHIELYQDIFSIIKKIIRESYKMV